MACYIVLLTLLLDCCISALVLLTYAVSLLSAGGLFTLFKIIGYCLLSDFLTDVFVLSDLRKCVMVSVVTVFQNCYSDA